MIRLSGEATRGGDGDLCLELASPVAHGATHSLRRSDGSEVAIWAAVQTTTGALSMTPAELQAVPPQASSQVCFRPIGSVEGTRPNAVVLSVSDSVAVRAVRWWTGTHFAGT